MPVKTCSKCRVEKPIEDFSTDATNPDGRRYACRPCQAAAQSEQRRQARERADAAAMKVAAMSDADRAALAAFGLPIERECAEAIGRYRDVVTAADSLGLSPSVLRAHLAELERRAARRGWSPAHDMQKTTPDGYHVKGVSTYYKAVEDPETGAVEMRPRGQWVKTSKDADEQLAMFIAAMKAVAEPFRGALDPTPAATGFTDDLLTVYPFGDPHVGMYAWSEEAGEDFDLKIAERELVAAVDHLVEIAPASRHAVIVPIGDNMHVDSSKNETAGGTRQDVDTRYPKVLSTTFRALRRTVDRALLKHEDVVVRVVPGNHDTHSSVALGICMEALYEREPRVRVDLSPAAYWWHRFGACLLGFGHGHLAKMDALPLVMATDRAKDWGETLYRQIYTGHIHHERVREFPGVTIRSLRTLAGKDAWHAGQGYRSLQEMTADVWHRDWGLVATHRIGVARVRRQIEQKESETP